MIGKIISHYKIIEKLGEGGMGVVYKAQDTKLDRMVALKFLPSHLTKKETDLGRFVQEAKAAAALNHNNVCTIHEIHDESENPFIVMEYVEGETLKARIKEKVKSKKETIDIAIQIAEALKAAHKKGVIHRDIKSENIMVTETGQVKVMDFGLAKLRGSVKLTKTSSTVGTVAYMSPEHLQGKGVDGRTDIFSFGVVLYEMLTGKLPFKGEYDSAVMYAIINEEPEPIQKHRTDLSSELLHVLNRALEKDPAERYQSVNDMLIDLKRLKRDTGTVSGQVIAETTISGKKLHRFSKRAWITVSVSIVLIVVMIGLGIRLLKDQKQIEDIRENSIAVMYFDDRSGEENFGKILAEMLTSNLSRCKQIDVVSSQYLFDILKKMGKEDIESIDRSMATEIAENARVQTMLLGSIDKIGSRFNINAQLCDVGTGSVIGPAQASGTRVEDVYNMVNTLTNDVVALMDVSHPEAQPSFNINDVTTNSFEAYKHYHKGLELVRRFDWREARNQFRGAIQIDTTFAMAHSWLAYSLAIFKIANPLSDISNERAFINLAKRHSKNTTDLERMQIEIVDAMLHRDMKTMINLAKKAMGKYPDEKDFYKILGIAYMYTGEYRSAIQYFKRELEINHDVPNTHCLMAYCYSRLDEHDRAISTVRNYITLQPDILNTYDSAIDIYLKAGMYDDALETCKHALLINPDWTSFIQMQGVIHLLMGEGEKARDKNRLALESRPEWELILTDDLGCFSMVEGKYHEAAEAFKKVVRLAKNTENEIDARLVLGKFYRVQKMYGLAVEEFSAVKELSVALDDQTYNTWPIQADYYRGVTAIEKGEPEQAHDAADRIKNYIEKKGYDSILLDYYYLLLAELDVVQSRPDKALKKIYAISSYSQSFSPRCRMLIAEIHAMKNEINKAILLYERLYHHFETAKSYIGGNWFDYFHVRSMIKYKIARLYDKAGDRQSAIRYYQQALEQWKNADNDLPEKADAEKKSEALY